MTRLKVAVRIRPLSESENQLGSTSIIEMESKDTITITNIKVPEQNAGDSRERIRRFTFDYCFHEYSTQNHVFEAVESVIGKAVKSRYNSCVLAYGQSATGKTHTMMGFPHDPGLTPKLCQKIFHYLQESAVGDEVNNLRISVSYLEIYNEKVRDLLDEDQSDGVGKTFSKLKVREHPKNGPYVQGLSEHSVNDSSGLIHWLETGNNRRRVAATLTNPLSSRSHSIFTINCTGAKLQLVDLAGSERAGSRCFSPARFREGANINRSLVALGNVILALAEHTGKNKNARRFIPYRDSVLTWLLKDTLGGNSNTVMIATVSPASHCYNETVNTLRFGQRAKLIVSRPVVIDDPKENTIRELRAEIAKLRELLQQIQSPMHSVSSPTEKVDQSGDTKDISTVEKILPLMDVTSSIAQKKPQLKPKELRRTFSVVDRKVSNMDKDKQKLFGSHDAISTTTTSSGDSSRRSSINKLKPIPQRKPLLGKSERGVGTETRGIKVEAKVDSIRRQPRSQIVAAVTSRLYSKTKKKEVATDTDDIKTYRAEPKELTICSNARLRLRELTQRALKAHRNRNEETQTDLYPVLRLKEIATDVDDLRVALLEVQDMATNSQLVETKDMAIECHFLESSTLFTSTRSCGTQIEETVLPQAEAGVPASTPMSFTKYLLRDICPNNPIYTSAVNINISNNYMNGAKVSTSLSQDSLEEDQTAQNLCLPTPDLLSNHNSLEQQNHSTISCVICPEEGRLDPIESLSDELQFSIASCLEVIPQCTERLHKLELPTVCAPETRIFNYHQEKCQPMDSFYPARALAAVVEVAPEYHCDDCVVIKEPMVLKSIMKLPAEGQKVAGDDEEEEVDGGVFASFIPDSLEYHAANKQVRFSNEETKENQRLFAAMTSFLEEATTLMNNLTVAAGQTEDSYEFQVTVKDLPTCLHVPNKKRKRKLHCTSGEKQTQTSTNASTQLDSFLLPVNKYDVALEDSCKRLEEKINNISKTVINYNAAPALDDYSFPISPNLWDLDAPHEIEDSSIESNPLTFSDYGSLPRKTHKRQRTPTCSPSAFLKQLTTMRKQIIESSREELLKSNNFNITHS